MSPDRSVLVSPGTFIANENPFYLCPPQLSKRYGDIFGMHMGSMKFVMVNGMRLVKEVLVNQGDKFLDRPDIPIDKEIFSKIGELSLKTCLSSKVQALTLQRSETAGDKAGPWSFSPSVGDKPLLTGDVPARTDLLHRAPVEGTEEVHPVHAPKLRPGEEEPGGAHPRGVPIPRGCAWG